MLGESQFPPHPRPLILPMLWAGKVPCTFQPLPQGFCLTHMKPCFLPSQGSVFQTPMCLGGTFGGGGAGRAYLLAGCRDQGGVMAHTCKVLTATLNVAYTLTVGPAQE